MSKPLNILIAEDNEEAARLIKQAIKSYFSDKDMTILCSTTLETALTMARVRGPIAVGLIVGFDRLVDSALNYKYTS